MGEHPTKGILGRAPGVKGGNLCWFFHVGGGSELSIETYNELLRHLFSSLNRLHPADGWKDMKVFMYSNLLGLPVPFTDQQLREEADIHQLLENLSKFWLQGGHEGKMTSLHTIELDLWGNNQTFLEWSVECPAKILNIFEPNHKTHP